MKAHRPTIMGTRHMVAATQYLAAEAGFRILEAGGNAIDAGVAAGISLGVVQPDGRERCHHHDHDAKN